MNVSTLAPGQLARRLAGSGVHVQTGPFVVHIRTTVPAIAAGIAQLYADHPVLEGCDFADFHTCFRLPRSHRRWYHPKLLFYFDGEQPFKPLPADQALPMFEWALNWCVGANAHQYLIIHAAVIERGGFAAVLPAPPGYGKSTLTAALVHHGWRLLSDELAIIRPVDGRLVPLARPISLKNESIGVIRNFLPGAVISPEAPGTNKGTVAHLKPPAGSVARAAEPARPAWVIFPAYKPGAPARLTPRAKGTTFLEISENSFNYSLHGTTGFHLMRNLIDTCDCYEFAYSQFAEAIAVFDALRPPAAVAGGGA